MSCCLGASWSFSKGSVYCSSWYILCIKHFLCLEKFYFAPYASMKGSKQKSRWARITGQNIAILVICIILLQTLPFKFGAHPESVALFSRLWMEPRWRILTGIAELICSLGLLYRPTRIFATWGIIGLMIGAIASHVFILGRDTLARMALLVLVCTSYLVYHYFFSLNQSNDREKGDT